MIRISDLRILVIFIVILIHTTASFSKDNDVLKKVYEGIVKENNSLADKNELLLKQIEIESISDENAKQYFLKSQEAVTISKKLTVLIQNISDDIILKSGNDISMIFSNSLKTKIIKEIMIDNENGNVLAKRIIETIERLNNLLVLEKNQKNIFHIQNIDKENIEGWVLENFNNTSIGVTLIYLAQLKNEMIRTENSILELFYKKITNNEVMDYYPDKYIPLVILDKNVFHVGDDVSGKIALGAYQTKQDIDVFISGELIDVNDGIANFSFIASSYGFFEHPVKIVAKNKETGVETTYKSILKYNVNYPLAIFSLSDMNNILFSEIDNIVYIAVPGYKPQDVIVDIEGPAEIINDGVGKYIVKITDENRIEESVRITASVRYDIGNRKIGIMQYKIIKGKRPF